VLSVVGTYTIQNNIVDVYWMLGFGIFGYVLKMYGFQVAPIILGIILGPLMDMSYRRAMMAEQDNIYLFLHSFVTSPLSLVLSLAIVLMLISQTPLWAMAKQRLQKKNEDFPGKEK
jgi:putative tricarboxylic transport membrane protein